MQIEPFTARDYFHQFFLIGGSGVPVVFQHLCPFTEKHGTKGSMQFLMFTMIGKHDQKHDHN